MPALMISSSSLSMSRLALLLPPLAAGFQASSSEFASGQMYSQNAICRPNNCVNPLMPGLNDLPNLQQLVWVCEGHSTVTKHLEFCKAAVNYDPSLPAPSNATPVRLAVKAQDDAAATMFFYHLSGLGYEAWEHAQPWKSSDTCVRSIWRMVCFTYFPKAEAGCSSGQVTPYQKPCRDCCENYLQACNVECCDESARCIFNQEVTVGNQTSMVQTGYYDAAGPSARCTGGGGSSSACGLGAPGALLLGLLGLQLLANTASDERSSSTAAASSSASSARTSPRSTAGLSRHLLAAALALCALSLSGCSVSVPRHELGNWRAAPDYLIGFEFVEPGKAATTATINSCRSELPPTLQCSGHGYCVPFNMNDARGAPLMFCKCDRDWADPECRTRRKSQTTTFILALFGGPFGLDYFYLGLPLWGCAKLFTLGGLGFWWVVDVIRAGSGAVYAHDFRVAADLPHWVFVVSTLAIFMAVGFLVSLRSYLLFRQKKRDDVLKLQQSEEARTLGRLDEADGPRLRASAEPRRTFSGYGATLPMAHPNAAAPYAGTPGYAAAAGYSGTPGPAGQAAYAGYGAGYGGYAAAAAGGGRQAGPYVASAGY